MWQAVTRKKLTEFDKILDRPDCTAGNSCSKICSRLCQILSNSVKFLQARSRFFPKSAKRELRRFELQNSPLALADISLEHICNSNRPLKAKMEFDNICKNLTSSCANLTSTRKNLTEFDKILDRPDWTAENSCSKICSRLCQILSNFYKLGAEIFQSPSNVSYVDLSSNQWAPAPFAPLRGRMRRRPQSRCIRQRT